MTLVNVTLSGDPVPQGSMVGHVAQGRRLGAKARVVMRSDTGGRLGQWRKAIGWLCCASMDAQPSTLPVAVTLAFALEGDPGRAPRTPDLDKLVRAVLDAMTGIVYVDDKQVVSLHATKVYTRTGPGVTITVETTEGD